MMKSKLLRFRDGDVIFREGDVGDCAYLIEQGKVLFFISDKRGEVALNVAGPGEVFGEISLIDDYPRSASCRAIGDVELIVVTKEQLLDRINSADSVVRLLMRTFLQRLRRNIDLLHGQQVVRVLVNENAEREKSEVAGRFEFESRIFKAVEEDQFIPHYQPIYDLNTQQVVGCEALMRWKTADGALLPSAFLDVLEESASIFRVGQHMFETCMTDVCEMRKAFAPAGDFFVGINVSARQFAHAGFLENLENVRRKCGADARHIKLEITEKIMMDGPKMLPVLNECVKAGYKLAIDDFGTGFSSLQYLAAMPLTDLKIDRSFVREMAANERAFAVVKSLIQLAGALGLNLIAEGIETVEDLNRLKSLGVVLGQGFLFSKALPLAEFLKLNKRAA